MRFALVVLVALGATVAWQASVVADNNQQQGNPSVLSTGSAAVQGVASNPRG